MFPKPNRLPSEAFTRVFRTGKRIHGEIFGVIAAPNSQPLSRFAVWVGVKIDKRATKRNRMKRLVREAVRHLLPTIKPGFDCIIIAKKNFSEKKGGVEHSLQELLTRLNLSNNVTM
ncbi:MAG: Ribonuclease P protein component [Candidatus Gottesmanbacteria bacterium GW2011_GWB1_44_11c]|uniref:Ribonuclease P protein component n=1 Tax=Candidatus Gottesmanbacteria bacterium GW2011_GWB1_44_11c TaxID=1618447 RepID=A0A0G1GHC3_9BACT|nr:MAG: Ribonuclease P protein component [Candidatus Gottesmanbacteria bacterium GW2011_GWB1_44_11c]HCM82917.1 ribonuclease P protein component [Patescibacteria group bacterium]